MEDFDLTLVARKSVKGVFALASRTFLVTVFSAVTQLILTIFLDPSVYGVFYVVSAIVVFLTFFQDIGLAGSLIQKKEALTKNELRTVFTVQQVLVFIFVLPALFFSKWIAAFYHLNSEGTWLFIVLLFSLVLSSLRTIPTVILERNLNFDKLVIPQIAENVAYNITLIVCAVRGLGITSFTIAILVREFVGLGIMYAIQPWPIGIHFEKKVFRELISFGLPFQVNSLLALVKDNLLTLYIGRVLALNEVGYIGFAQKLAFLPLRFIMDHVIKITFPSFSRLQHDKKALQIIIEKSLFIIAFLIFPISIGISLYASSIIHFIPIANYQQKWNPSYLWVAIVFFSLNAIVASVTVPLTNFLNAIGKVKTTLHIMVLLTVVTWVVTPLLIVVYGYNGVAIASFIAAASALVTIYSVKKHITFSFTKCVYGPFLGAVSMIIYFFITQEYISSFLFLLIIMFFAGTLYLGVVFIFNKKEILSAFQFARQSIQHKNINI